MFLICLLVLAQAAEVDGRCTGESIVCADIDHESCPSQRGCRVEQACSTRNEDLCALNPNRARCEAVGCMWGAGCEGIADDCGSVPLANCAYQQGCTVDHEAGTCIGQPRACGSYRDFTACGQTRGCRWQNHCAVAVPSPRCHNVRTPWQCQDMDGCAWAYMCGGRPQTCAEQTNEKACRGQSGCHWEPPPAPKKRMRARAWQPKATK